jgi:uncharacterized protein YcnI
MRKSTLPVAVGAGVLLAVAAPLAASAHVTVDPGSAEPGSYALITVKVPNESDTAETNRLELTLPTDEPFTSVRTVPVPGWDAELVRDGDTVTSIVWTAQPGSEIGDGELGLFPFSAGPVPEVGSLLLPADQGYTDGSVVSWSDADPEAELPAPVLAVLDEPADHHGGASAETHDEAAAAPAAAQPDVLARVLGIAGLVAGVIGLVVALLSRRSAKP